MSGHPCEDNSAAFLVSPAQPDCIDGCIDLPGHCRATGRLHPHAHGHGQGEDEAIADDAGAVHGDLMGGHDRGARGTGGSGVRAKRDVSMVMAMGRPACGMCR